MTPARARVIAAFGAALVLAPAIAAAQTAAPSPSSTGKGAEILAQKCLQCHRDAMWVDQRQDRRAWEATLYRMVGRGAAWEQHEISAMADYLGTDFGPNVPGAAGAVKK